MQLRSPVRHVIDDFSNNTLTGFLNSEYQTTQGNIQNSEQPNQAYNRVVSRKGFQSL